MTPPMPSVLHVINRFGPGGAEKQLRGLVARSNLRHEVIELDDSPPARRLAQLRRELSKHDTQVLVAWLDRPQIATAAVANRRPVLIASVRGFPRRSGWSSSWMLRGAIARYDHVVTNSAAARAGLVHFLRPLRVRDISVIPNGVEIVPPLAPRLEPPLRIGFIGRANSDKGIDVMLAALSSQHLPDATAVLIGDRVPQAVAAHGAPLPPTEVHSSVRDPWAVAGDLDVLVVPSRTEGLPNVVLEAFVRSLPVVATDVGGTTELVSRDRGELVPSEDPTSIARAIRRMADDPDAARSKAARARQYAIEHFGWDRIVDLWDNLFHERAGGERPNRV